MKLRKEKSLGICPAILEFADEYFETYESLYAVLAKQNTIINQ